MYWNINDEKPKWFVCNDENLPEELKEPILASDSRFRPDIKFMLEKDMDQAEKEKHQLEEVQRKDKHLRQKAAQLRDKK